MKNFKMAAADLNSRYWDSIVDLFPYTHIALWGPGGLRPPPVPNMKLQAMGEPASH